MIYLIAGGLCAYYGIASGLGAVTLLRPLLDAISPLPPASVAMLCTMAALCASLVSAFFALGQPIPLPQEDLLLLAVGAALGGILGDLAANRFFAVMPASACTLLQNALLLTLIALPQLYFTRLSRTLMPLALPRTLGFPVALTVGLLGSFLAFGAEPLTLMLFFLLFDAEDGESAFAALTITLFSMAGKLLMTLIRARFALPDAATLLWLLPGAILGALLAMLPPIHRLLPRRAGDVLLRLSLFTSLLNMAASSFG